MTDTDKYEAAAAICNGLTLDTALLLLEDADPLTLAAHTFAVGKVLQHWHEVGLPVRGY